MNQRRRTPPNQEPFSCGLRQENTPRPCARAVSDAHRDTGQPCRVPPAKPSQLSADADHDPQPCACPPPRSQAKRAQAARPGQGSPRTASRPQAPNPTLSLRSPFRTSISAVSARLTSHPAILSHSTHTHITTPDPNSSLHSFLLLPLLLQFRSSQPVRPG
jgi:hypothetical protein